MSTHKVLTAAAIILSAIQLTACNKPTGSLTVGFPDPNTLEFTATLAKDADFALNGQILIPPYGDIYFTPATPSQGFTMGGRIDLAAFRAESWTFSEVSRLQTGAFFPPFIKTPLVEVPVGEDFFAYFGVRDQRYLGVAWTFIKSTSTPVGVGANYYDSAGNLVMGALFYPPEVTNGQVTQPGGLFMATNFSALSTGGLRVRTFAVEGGRIRAMNAGDLEIAKSYMDQLKAAQKERESRLR